MQKTFTVCNVCQDPALPTERYTLGLPGGRKAELDLCANDSTPIWNLAGRPVPDPPGKPSSAARETLAAPAGGSGRTPSRAPVKALPTKTPGRKVARRGGGAGRTPIMTMAQIEALKQSPS